MSLVYFFRRCFFRFCSSKYNFFYKKKIKHNYNYTYLKKFLENKKIALVGNSRILLKQNNKIDDYDIVIRINIPPPKKYHDTIGKRCDILMLSHDPKKLLDESYIKVWLVPDNANFTIHHVYSHKKLSPDYHLYHYKNTWWEELYKTLGSFPSSGSSAFHFLIKLLEKPNITLFGFEHRRGNDLKHQKFTTELFSDTHDFIAENKFFQSQIGKNIKYSDDHKKLVLEKITPYIRKHMEKKGKQHS